MENKNLATDRKSVQFLLRSGLAVAVLLMAVGVLIKCVTGNWETPEVRLFELFHAPLSPGDRIMGIGILALAATPAFRVIALLILWTRERDWKFVITALIVMLTLALAIALGGG